jgi:beta-galactosidase
LDAPAVGRYFCLEALNSQQQDIYTTVAELKLLGSEGGELNRSGWKIVYADSEEMSAENGSAANVLDLNPDTFWHTQWDTEKPEHPHHLVIDLGKEEIVSGIGYLPRQDEPHGLIREFRLYVSGKRFPGL